MTYKACVEEYIIQNADFYAAIIFRGAEMIFRGVEAPLKGSNR